jgi:hypothetical protein
MFQSFKPFQSFADAEANAENWPQRTQRAKK